jgi:hypothetical protein
MTDTRDIRFTAAQIRVLEDAAYRRIRQLEKSIRADSGTFHNALEEKCRAQAELKIAREALQVAERALTRKGV